MTDHPAPRSDDDPFDVIDDAMSALAERRGLWIGDDHVVIHLLASLIDQAERCLPARHHRPGQRLHLERPRPATRHQARRGPAALRPRLADRRREVAPELLSHPTTTEHRRRARNHRPTISPNPRSCHDLTHRQRTTAQQIPSR